MKSFSNTYIFIFSTIMVVIVAALLSSAAILLQPLQKRNIEINKKQNILSSINIESNAKNAEKIYKQNITESYVIDYKGNIKTGIDAFKINLKKEITKEIEEMNLPIFVGTVKDSTKVFVIPVRGKGLWGPIWGYIAFNNDFNTIYGAKFSHKSETPGLGAEIATKEFQSQFIGKKIFDNTNKFVSVSVMKGGTANLSSDYEVDGISGGTITSKAVEKMIFSIIDNYKTYFKSQTNKIKPISEKIISEKEVSENTVENNN
ncbi:MAG: NADH:ubiquinone reductase (Na(+)-transporting) subunit C [Bacteroidota bacterium]|nr:NADH:ubiquinone reductase (Na(+)-transporting) subunit C [Bacteroidota bacterium]